MSTKSTDDIVEELLFGRNPKELMRVKGVTETDLRRILEYAEKFFLNYELKEAQIMFAAYAQMMPVDHRGVAGLAAIALEKKDYKSALSFLELLKTFPTNDLDETFLNISLCYYKTKKEREAAGALLIVKEDKLSDFNKKRYEFLRKQLNKYL